MLLGPFNLITVGDGILHLGPFNLVVAAGSPVPTITSVSNAVAGGRVTINTSGVDLSTASTVTATCGGVVLTAITINNANSLTATMPLDGFRLGSVVSFVVTVAGMPSASFGAVFQPALGAYTTLSVAYAQLHPDSWLRRAEFASLYSDVQAGDQVEYPPISAPSGLPVTVTSTGLMAVSGAGGSTPTQTVDFALIDALGTTGNYRRGNVSSATFSSLVSAYPAVVSAPASRTLVVGAAARMEAGGSVFQKQPDEILDFDFDLTDLLAIENDDVLPGSIVCECSGLDVLGYGRVTATDRIKVWLGGGSSSSSSEAFKVELTFTTLGYRTMQFEMLVVVVDR